MQITGFAYRAFYNKLVETLLESCFPPKKRKLVITKSPEFWELESEVYKNGKLLYEIAYGEEAINENQRYLYNKQSEYKKDSHLGTVGDLIIISCLRFMGYHTPENIKNPSFLLHEPVQAAVLFQIFAEDVIPDYEREYLAEFRVFDHATNSIIESAFAAKRGKLKAIKKDPTGDIVFEITEDELWRFQAHRKLSKFIEQYFTFLNDHNFKAAMNLWHPATRYELWNDQLQDFQRLYWNLNNIYLEGIYLNNSQINTSSYRFRMTYVQEVKVQYAPDLFDFIDKITLKDTKKIVSTIDTLLARTERNNFKISEMGLQSLLDFSAIEKLHVLGAYDQKRLEEVLPFNTIRQLVRLATCEVEEVSSGELVFKFFANDRLIHYPNHDF